MPTALPEPAAAPSPPDRASALRVLFGAEDDRRYTQDTPVLPEVWIGYAMDPLTAQDLLMTPRRDATAGAVAAEIRERLRAFREGEARERERRGLPARPRPREGLVHLPGTVVARLELDEAMRLILPSTGWWRRRVASLTALGDDRLAAFPRPGAGLAEALGEALFAHGLMGPVPADDPSRRCAPEGTMPTDLLRLVRLTGAIALQRRLLARHAGEDPPPRDGGRGDGQDDGRDKAPDPDDDPDDDRTTSRTTSRTRRSAPTPSARSPVRARTPVPPMPMRALSRIGRGRGASPGPSSRSTRTGRATSPRSGR